MVTATFDQLFSRLVRTFKRYQDVPRYPDNVVAIASARRNLDIAREEIAIERADIVDRRVSRAVPRRTAVSDADLARLRVFGSGFVGS
ncbi:MAG: hypothetical protein ACC654_05800 [Acidimicrobiia bacterium]